MKIRIGGPLPIRFDLNGPMAWGMGLGLVGAAGGLAGFLGLYPRGSLFGEVSFGTVLLGGALYLVGRIVQIVRMWRNR